MNMIGNEMFMKANFFFERKITIHISCNDKRFYNGLIIELHQEFILINNRVLGETPVYFSEINSVERFKENDTLEVGE